MKIKIITIGEPKLSFAKTGFGEYVKRLRGYHKVEVLHFPDAVKDEKIIKDVDNTFCVVLDENGREFTSRELAEFLEKKSTHGIGEMCFLIGGPDGHSDEIKIRADLLMSMSQLTFPHDIAMMVLAETLYRASTINSNHPYHRD